VCPDLLRTGYFGVAPPAILEGLRYDPWDREMAGYRWLLHWETTNSWYRYEEAHCAEGDKADCCKCNGLAKIGAGDVANPEDHSGETKQNKS